MDNFSEENAKDMSLAAEFLRQAADLKLLGFYVVHFRSSHGLIIDGMQMVRRPSASTPFRR